MGEEIFAGNGLRFKNRYLVIEQPQNVSDTGGSNPFTDFSSYVGDLVRHIDINSS